MGYWEERQTEMYRAGEMKVNQYFTKLEKAFNQTKRELQKTVESFYWRYAEENSLTYAAAQQRLDKDEIGELKDFIDLAMQNIGKYNQTVNNMSIKARMTRYQALEAQVDALLRQLYAVDYEAMAEQSMQEVYGDAYYRTWYSIDQYRGFHSAFAQVDPTTVNTLLEYPFNGANFSSRLWKQKDHLQTVLMESLTTMMVQGVPPQNLAADFAKKMQSKKFEAYRLLHTEASFLMSEAAHAGYKEDGVEQYEVIATLDSKTCNICGELDGKVYPVEEAVTGKNMPPFHCFCRCTDAPHYDDTNMTDMTRAARDADGDPIEVPADMTWKEWKEQFIDNDKFPGTSGGNGEGRIQKLSELDDDVYRNMGEIIGSAPKYMQDLIEEHYDSIRFRNAKNIRFGVFKSRSSIIEINFENELRNPFGPFTVAFHEIGHCIDGQMGHLSERIPDFAKILKQDSDGFIKNAKKLYKTEDIYDTISKELTQYDAGHSVSDLLGAITRNKICVPGRQHSTDYWKKPHKLEHEAFAHFFEASIRNDADKLEIIRTVFPNAYQSFVDALKER